MSASTMSRRRLLAALGALGPAFALRTEAAWGAQTTPTRVLFYVTSHGTVYDSWRLLPPGVPSVGDWAADLGDLPAGSWSPILEPLQERASDLLVLDGIGNGCALSAFYQEHPVGNASCQTGRIPSEVASGSGRLRVDGPSIDQVIAATRATPFASLEYAVGGAPVAYDDGGNPLPVVDDPIAAWRRLFPEADPTDQTGRFRGDALSRVAGRYDALAGRLSSAAAPRIEAHGDLVRDLQVRLDRLAQISCAAPESPTEAPVSTDADFPLHQVDAFGHLVTTAFACGLSDVATLRVDAIPPATVGAPPGDLHTDVAHQVGDPDAVAAMITYHTWHAARVAALCDLLDAVPDGDGTLLDHTLVVWHNEMATGDHWFDTLPVVIAGGSRSLDTGRVVRWAPRYEIRGQSFGVPHQRLLASIGVAAGLDLSGFGAPVLDGADGSIDCTGRLDRVHR